MCKYGICYYSGVLFVTLLYCVKTLNVSKFLLCVVILVFVHHVASQVQRGSSLELVISVTNYRIMS